jgi:CHAT domain-containing protein
VSRDPLERAARLHAAGIAANAQMHPVTGVRLLRQALRILQNVGESAQPLRGRVLLSLALAESERGAVGAGLQLLDEAEGMLPPAQRGVLHGQRGMLLRRTGRDDMALAEYARALRLLDEQGDAEEVCRVLLNRAVLHMAAARSGLARADLRRLLDLAERHGFPRLAAKAGHNLGYLDYLAGELPSALRRYAAAARHYAEVAPGMLPVLSLDRARALLAAGLFADADRELDSALQQLRRQRASQDHAEAHLARAEAVLLAGRPAAARRWAARAHRLFDRRDNPRWTARAALLGLQADQAAGGRWAADLAERATMLASSLRDLGMSEDTRIAALIAVRASAARGDLDAAARLLARHAARPADRLDTRLLWRLAAAEVAAASGDAPAADRQLREGLAALGRQRTQLGALDLLTAAAVHGRELAAHGLRAALSRGDVGEIFQWAERARAQALLMSPVRAPQEPETAAALAELRSVRAALDAAELAGRPARGLRTRVEELQRLLREHSWHAPGSAAATRPARLARIRQQLGDAALVSYLPDGQRLRALVVTRDRAAIVRLGRRQPAQEALLRLRADLDAQAGRALTRRLADAIGEATRRDAAALAAAILDPILAQAGDRELVVVPTGPLVTVPWPVLPGCAGRPITVAPSATLWGSARTRMAESLGADSRSLLVAGPGNERGEPEVRQIAALRPGAKVLTAAAATAAATLAELPGADLAHIAAHGQHQTDNALFSGLDLAGGPLMGYDLQQLASTPAMVVLSSCDLGLHDTRPGDETLGMASALLAAGTSTVIASVCRVADETAMAVTVGYHRALLAGRSPAHALAQAMPDDRLSGFVCFGAG